jgi:hypothetical protein
MDVGSAAIGMEHMLLPKSSLQGFIHGVSREDYLGGSHPSAERTHEYFFRRPVFAAVH